MISRHCNALWLIQIIYYNIFPFKVQLRLANAFSSTARLLCCWLYRKHYITLGLH